MFGERDTTIYSTPYIMRMVYTSILDACTKARPDGGWAAVLLGSNSICMLT